MVGKDVTVGDKQDTWFLVVMSFVPVRLEQFPTYLKSHVCLTRACSHGEQYALLLVGDSCEHIVNGDLLIVPWHSSAAYVERLEVEPVSPIVGLGKSHLPQLVGRGEGVDQLFGGRNDIVAECVLHAHVDEIDLIAVGGIGVANLQHCGIEFGLLHTGRHIFFIGLGFNHGEFDTLVLEDIIGFFRMSVDTQFLHASGRDVCALFG